MSLLLALLGAPDDFRVVNILNFAASCRYVLIGFGVHTRVNVANAAGLQLKGSHFFEEQLDLPLRVRSRVVDEIPERLTCPFAMDLPARKRVPQIHQACRGLWRELRSCRCATGRNHQSRKK